MVKRTAEVVDLDFHEVLPGSRGKGLTAKLELIRWLHGVLDTPEELAAKRVRSGAAERTEDGVVVLEDIDGVAP